MCGVKGEEDSEAEVGQGREGGTGGGGNATTPYAFLTVAVSGLGTARFQVGGGGLWPGDGWVLVRRRDFDRGPEVNFELRRTAHGWSLPWRGVKKITTRVFFMFGTLYKDEIVTLLVLGPCSSLLASSV
jgi:hypothetical protein